MRMMGLLFFLGLAACGRALEVPEQVEPVRPLDGSIYVFGGDQPQTFEAYDPAHDAWHSLGAMPTPRDESVAVTGADGRVYLIGGSWGSHGPLDNVDVYDPRSGSWS